jgi:hypothetical protein
LRRGHILQRPIGIERHRGCVVAIPVMKFLAAGGNSVP